MNNILTNMDETIENLRYNILKCNCTKPVILVHVNDFLPSSVEDKKMSQNIETHSVVTVKVEYNHNYFFSKRELLRSISKILLDLSNDYDDLLLSKVVEINKFEKISTELYMCEWCENKKIGSKMINCGECNRTFCEDCKCGDDVTPEGGVNCCELDIINNDKTQKNKTKHRKKYKVIIDEYGRKTIKE